MNQFVVQDSVFVWGEDGGQPRGGVKIADGREDDDNYYNYIFEQHLQLFFKDGTFSILSSTAIK